MLSSESLWSLGGSLLCKDRKTDSLPGRDCGDGGDPFFWGRDTRVLVGRILWSAMFTHEWNFPTQFSASPVHSFSVFCFCSNLMIRSLIWLRRREAIENLVVGVHSWQHSEMSVTKTGWGGGVYSLDNQSSANLISCCHGIFLLTITAPPLPSTPLPLLRQSWFSFAFILDLMLWDKRKILTPDSLSYDWGFGYAEAHTCLFRFSE